MSFCSQFLLEIAAALPRAAEKTAGFLAENAEVPEPSVAIALILGSVGMLWILRRRN